MVERIRLKKQFISSLNVPAVVALGHPLLDVLVTLENHELWEKFNLPSDEALELPNEKIQELIDNIPSNVKPTLAAGGCAQNTLRILQWLLDQTNSMKFCLYSGCLGKDSRGIALQEIVEASGVQTRYAIHPTLHTGICVSLIRNSIRTLVANLGAAGIYTLDDLKNSEIPFDNVQILYIEGFFITHSLNVAQYLIERTKTQKIIITFNLNGEYIFKDHHAAICKMVRLSKIIFGNAKEMSALATAFNLKFENINDLPFLLSKFINGSVDGHCLGGENWLTNEHTIFVMTQGGSSPAIVVWGQGESNEVQPIPPKAPIVDTTGAGDSLVAGFLAGVLARWNPKDCLEFGCKVASFMITQLGVTLPHDVPDDLFI